MRTPGRLSPVITGILLATTGAAFAEQATSPARPADKPPIAQGWIDLATFSSPGMPAGMAGMMGGMSAGGGGATGNPLYALMGGPTSDSGNLFGNTHTGGSGRYMDVTLRTLRNPGLAEALQSVPAASQLAPTLQLKVLPQARHCRIPPTRPSKRPRKSPKAKSSCTGAVARPSAPGSRRSSTLRLETRATSARSLRVAAPRNVARTRRPDVRCGQT